ncbi:unnamed protein product [Calicophoron daubneyi]|uniref:UPF0506 domain-containing protein n=1 Tax=Calicophoron daubneyi TaxID=300641 RepID=A0AAV2TLR5_CALDB
MRLKLSTYLFVLLALLPVEAKEPTLNCKRLGEECSRFYKDKQRCCWPHKCQQVDEYKGKCVECIEDDEFCVDKSECCSGDCWNYLCKGKSLL